MINMNRCYKCGRIAYEETKIICSKCGFPEDECDCKPDKRVIKDE